MNPRRASVLLSMCCLASASWGAPAVPAVPTSTLPVYVPQVVARLPHDPAAFTEGLELDGGVLYEGTGLNGQSDVRRVEPRTGTVRSRRAPPEKSVFGEGVSVLNGRLYQLTWQSGTAFVYDAATLTPTKTFRYTGEGWGLTHDRTQLIMSDGSDTLKFRDPGSFAVTRTLKVTAQGVPVTELNELEYAGGWIWANVWMEDRVARIDPKTGRVTAWLDVSALAAEATRQTVSAGRSPTLDDVANGVAFDAARGTLLLTGKRWPTVFEVRVPGLGPSAGQ